MGAYYRQKREEVIRLWEDVLKHITIEIPDKEVMDTLRANTAYILINADENILKPGSRNYDSSWMRDGAFIGTALLYMGFDIVVKEYLYRLDLI